MHDGLSAGMWLADVDTAAGAWFIPTPSATVAVCSHILLVSTFLKEQQRAFFLFQL